MSSEAFDAQVRELVEALEQAPADTLPDVLAALERTRGRVLARLMAPRAPGAEQVLLTMKEVAERLSIRESQARELGRRGELPTVTVGERFVRVRQDSLEEWIRRREAGGKLASPR